MEGAVEALHEENRLANRVELSKHEGQNSGALSVSNEYRHSVWTLVKGCLSQATHC